MITRNNKLEIFENFQINESLKKSRSYSSDTENSVNRLTVEGDTFSVSASLPSFGENAVATEKILLTEYATYVFSQEKTIRNWLYLQMVKYFFSSKRKLSNLFKYESIGQFFNNVHNSVKELELDPKSIEFYNEAVTNAVKGNQQALAEILTSKRSGLLAELNLLKSGVTKYIDETDIIKFFLESKVPKKILKLTWIKNFTRVIPSEVIEIKKTFDEKDVFDNYVILHFDKNDNSTEMTEKEKEKAKDPILFGVVKGSRKLFYVADWIDDYCDLTLDKLLETLNKKRIDKLSLSGIKKETLNTNVL